MFKFVSMALAAVTAFAEVTPICADLYFKFSKDCKCCTECPRPSNCQNGHFENCPPDKCPPVPKDCC